ncbi:unnamed protein product [Nippostrongylus brasiliensis]|uniref:Uncharacterized protein n=1 Tax=Nippostrongylus brasiliensis TaxID=27835 RepID=A0A0N4XQT9_NIPBR|nr:unnamed protein product [Nippostrongylus brasiliensis]
MRYERMGMVFAGRSEGKEEEATKEWTALISRGANPMASTMQQFRYFTDLIGIGCVGLFEDFRKRTTCRYFPGSSFWLLVDHWDPLMFCS